MLDLTPMRYPRPISRRGFLQGLTACAAAGWARRAVAAEGDEKSALVLLYLSGGYNSLFPSAGSFMGSGAFSVTASNVADLGNGLIVDKGSLGSLHPFAKSHMASIGIRHGISDHINAQISNLYDGQRNYAVALGAAMGGDAAIKVAALGNFPPESPRPAIGGVSFQQIKDMGTAIRVLGGGPATPETPGREVAALALARAAAMSNRATTKNPNALVAFKQAYETGVDTLKKPIQPFNFDVLAKEYTGKATGNATAVTDVVSRFIGTEMMIRAGANVVTIHEPGWDSHGDNGTRDRDTFARFIMPGLSKFVERTQTDAVLKRMNIVVAIMGDFARSLPGSDHQPNLTGTVMGKYVKTGTTGRVDGAVNLPPGTGGQLQFWAYVADALRVKQNPFGPHPHGKLIL
jgi:hypothetical protein